MKPEVQLLLSLVSDRFPEPEAIDESQSESFLAMCRRHRLDSYLGHRIQNNPCKILPEKTSQQLLTSLHGSKLRSRVMQQRFQRLADQFHRADIRFAALKGVDLARRIYYDPGLRPFDDIDILVAPADVTTVLKHLVRLGFETPPRLLPASWVRKFHFHLPLIHREENWMLEVHWRLMDKSILPAVPEKELWDEMQRSPEGYRILSPVHYATYLATHAAKHGFLNNRIANHARCPEFLVHPYSEIRLIWLLDIALMMTYEKVSPDAVLNTATEWVCRDAVGDVLALCSTLFPSACNINGAARSVRREGPVERRVKQRLMGAMQKELDGKDPCAESLPWLLVPSKTFHVRPIRLLTHG